MKPYMPDFHLDTFRLLDYEPQVSPAGLRQVEDAERRIGSRLPRSVREWYCSMDAIEILSKYSNQDWPIPPGDFAIQEWKTHRLLPFKEENQGVCLWAILLDGSDDPPVYIDVDSNGAQWTMQAPSFSTHIYACVWDYAVVLHRIALVQAQSVPLSSEAVEQLRRHFPEQPPTFGWPGSTQHRFGSRDQAILIWASEDQADWFVGAGDEWSLESALRTVWDFDGVGQLLYDCSEMGKAVLDRIRGRADDGVTVR
jgi:hypothetical protein